MFKLVIDGKPVGKARPRFGKGRAYSPKCNSAYEKKVKIAFHKEKTSRKLEGYIEADINIYYPLLSSDSKKIKEQKKAHIIRPDKKPDIDNVVKIVLDGLNGLAYNDDSQIIRVTAEKFYCDNPRVEVALREMGGDKDGF